MPSLDDQKGIGCHCEVGGRRVSIIAPVIRGASRGMGGGGEGGGLRLQGGGLIAVPDSNVLSNPRVQPANQKDRAEPHCI
jgi:hypothetical protein